MPLKLDQPRKKQLVSLTPLIDVVFILLLFFMLTSSFVAWRTLDTPLAAPSQEVLPEQDKQDPLLFELKANDGRVWFDNQFISCKTVIAFATLCSKIKIACLFFRLKIAYRYNH